MTEHPIIFSTDMVKAILDGKKTQTRRVIKPQPIYLHLNIEQPDLRKQIIEGIAGRCEYWQDNNTGKTIHCPYGQAGDRLWVKETFCQVCYKRDRVEDVCLKEDCIRNQTMSPTCGMKWTSAIFMPHWASRITLEITKVRVERIQDITEGDAEAEGTNPPIKNGNNINAISTFSLDNPKPYPLAIARFRALWDKINTQRGYSWESNPWVWVISFKVVEV